MVGQVHNRARVEGNGGSEMAPEMALKSYKYSVTQTTRPHTRTSCFLTGEVDNGLVRVIMGEDKIFIISFPLHNNTSVR